MEWRSAPFVRRHQLSLSLLPTKESKEYSIQDMTVETQPLYLYKHEDWLTAALYSAQKQTPGRWDRH
jgi:hypothetical protein